MMSVVFVSTFMNKYLDRCRETYISHIATYITEGGEDILYFCSELGKQLARENCLIEDVVAFHQSCLETLICSSDSFDAQALICMRKLRYLDENMNLYVKTKILI